MKTNKPVPLLGLAIGDALGMPFEMKQHNDSMLLSWNGKSYLSSDYHKLEAGQYTDDTQMSIALAKSILEAGKYDPTTAARYYLEWFKNDPRGIGGTIKEAMLKLEQGSTWDESGIYREGYCGNGTAMRISPLAIAYHRKPFDLIILADLDAQITHKHVDNEAGEGSVALSWAIQLLLNGVRPNLVLDNLLEANIITPKTRVKNKLILARDLMFENVHPYKAVQYLGNTGDIADTVSSAIYCAMFFDNNFARSIEVAIHVGGDTDTRASMVGALNACHLGLENIPDYFIFGLENPYELLDLNDKLMALNP